MTSLDQRLRFLRIQHGLFLLASIFYVLLPEYLLRNRTEISEPPPSELVYGVLAVGIAEFAFALLFWRRRISRAEQQVIGNPGDVTAHQSLQYAYVISFALGISIALYGFVLRFLGADLKQAAVLYGLGILLLLLSTPRRP